MNYQSNYLKVINIGSGAFNHLLTEGRIYEVQKWLPSGRVMLQGDNGKPYIFQGNRFENASEKEFIIQQIKLEYA